MSPEGFIFLKAFSSEFSYIKVWFADENSKLLEVEDKINTTLVIGWLKCNILTMTCYSVESRDQLFVKSYGFLPFENKMSKNIGKNIRKNLSGKYRYVSCFSETSWSC